MNWFGICQAGSFTTCSPPSLKKTSFEVQNRNTRGVECLGMSHGCGHPAWSTSTMKLWNYVIWIWQIFGFAWFCLLIVSVTYVRNVSVFYRMSAFLRRSSMWYLGLLNWTIVDGNFDSWEGGKSAAFYWFATNPQKTIINQRIHVTFAKSLTPRLFPPTPTTQALHF